MPASPMILFVSVAILLVALLIAAGYFGHPWVERMLPGRQTRLPPVAGFVPRIENLPYVVLAALCLTSVVARLVLMLR